MSEYDFALDLETKNTISVTVSWLEEAGCDGKRILELGPANGRLTRYLKETLGCSVTIVEIDEDAGAVDAECHGAFRECHGVADRGLDDVVVVDAVRPGAGTHPACVGADEAHVEFGGDFR